MTKDQHHIGSSWLKGSGLRPTRQRVTLAALLIGDGQDRHVTAESLFDAAKYQGEAVRSEERRPQFNFTIKF